MTSRDVVHLCSDIVVGAGGNLNDFGISEPTIRRAKKKALKKNAEKHKQEVKIASESAIYPIIAHFYGKIIADLIDGKKMKRDRFAVLVNIDGESKLLGIPPMDRGNAEFQYKCLIEILEDYDLLRYIKVLCFDSTATNTGIHTGTNIRFSKGPNDIILELACRRHVNELHIKHFSERIVSGKTVSPENQMFKKFQNEWNNIKAPIDPGKVFRFDCKAVRGSFLDIQIQKTISFCRFALNTNVFPRSDYRELLELTLMYLCPDMSFPIRTPGSISHARFLAKAITT